MCCLCWSCFRRWLFSELACLLGYNHDVLFRVTRTCLKFEDKSIKEVLWGFAKLLCHYIYQQKVLKPQNKRLCVQFNTFGSSCQSEQRMTFNKHISLLLEVNASMYLPTGTSLQHQAFFITKNIKVRSLSFSAVHWSASVFFWWEGDSKWCTSFPLLCIDGNTAGKVGAESTRPVSLVCVCVCVISFQAVTCNSPLLPASSCCPTSVWSWSPSYGRRETTARS